jgi:undecaprenyl pyrophosphate phosphatase UppP
MEFSDILSLSSSGLLAIATLIFNESIKEIIKKYFSVKSKKKINRLYWLLFILAVSVPIVIIGLAGGNKTDTKRIITAPVQSNGVEQIPNH